MTYIQLAVDIFLHLDVYLNMLIENFGALSYGILAAVVFCETGLVVTPFLPGDSLLFGVGAIAAAGYLSLPILFVSLFFAALGGDNLNYWLGRTIGPKVFQRGNNRIFKQEYLLRTQEFYVRHGGLAVVLARFMPIIRTFSPFVAGVGRMAYPRFLMYSVGGALTWITLFLLGGYYFGNLSFVRDHFSLIIIAVILVSVSPALIGFVRSRKAQARKGR